MHGRQVGREAKDLRDAELFCSLVAKGLAVTGLTLEEVAAEFNTAPGTVSRWANRHTAPALFERKTIVEFFIHRATAKIRLFGKPAIL